MVRRDSCATLCSCLFVTIPTVNNAQSRAQGAETSPAPSMQVTTRVGLVRVAYGVGETLELRAQLLSEDESMNLFDGNLLLAGVIPVRTALTNRGGTTLTAKKLEFQLIDSSGRRFKLIKPKDAIDQMIKYYGYRAYSYQPTQEMKERFASHGLNFDKALQPAESRQGLIFFKQEKDSPQPSGLRLQLTGVTSERAITVALN